MMLTKIVEESKKHLQFLKEMTEVMNAENREEALRVFMQERRKSESLSLCLDERVEDGLCMDK